MFLQRFVFNLSRFVALETVNPLVLKCVLRNGYAAGFSQIALRVIAALMVVGFLGQGTPVAAACKNFVGGVCLDKKKPTVKKKTTRKKTTKKQAVTSKKAAPSRSDPFGECLVYKERVMQLQKIHPRTRFVQYIYQNKCTQTIVAYMIASPCGDPMGSFEHKKNKPKFVATIPPKSRKTFAALQSRSLVKSKQPTMQANYYYASEAKSKGAYPKWSSGCR